MTHSTYFSKRWDNLLVFPAFFSESSWIWVSGILYKCCAGLITLQKGAAAVFSSLELFKRGF